MKYKFRKETLMFNADITINFANGSIGAKVIQAASLEQVMDDACHYVTKLARDGKNYLDIHNDDRYTVVKHSVKGYENE
jgi:hypothetical protein